MSDDDNELDSLLRDIQASSEETSSSSDNGADAGDAAVEEYHTTEISAEENSMSSDDDSTTYESEGATITQAEIYDNLKRISELEDERQAIQEELKDRTGQLRSMLKHIDRGSILYKMLVSAIPGQDRDAAPKVAPKATGKSKKTPKKKTAAPAVGAPPAKKKTAKKKAARKKARR